MIYIILPVHNRKNITEEFIKCLIMQTIKNFKLVLVDDGCTDGTVEMVLSYLPESVVLKGNGNLWWAGALQAGYKWIRDNINDGIVLLINDDTIFDQYFLQIGLNIMSNKEKTLLLAQCFSQNTNRLIDRGVHFDFRKLRFQQAKTKDDINCLSTRGLFLKVNDFKEIGGFYPKLLPHYLSDYEFTIRAYKKGYKLVTNKALKLYVNEETTGFHKIHYNSILEYYSKYFSNLNPANPLHWMAFVVLTVPFPYKLYHLLRLTYTLMRSLFKPFTKNSIYINKVHK